MAKMTVCKVCKVSVAASAKVCPSCGAKRKKPLFFRLLLLILLVIVIVAIASSGSNSNNQGTPATGNTKVVSNATTVAPISVSSPDKALTTLDEFIARYNDLMVEVEYETTFGIDAKLAEKDIIIKSGEVNDTAQIMLPDYKGGAIQLNLVKNTRNIKEIWLFLLTRGPNMAPERLLELFGVLAEGAGAVKEDSDVVEVMYELGLYNTNAFEVGKEANMTSNGVNIGYKIMTYQSDLYLFAYATPK